MQGTIVMLMALSGLGCHHKSCDVAFAPSYYGSGGCYGGCYGGDYSTVVEPSCYSSCYADGYSGCYSGGYGGCYSGGYGGGYGYDDSGYGCGGGRRGCGLFRALFSCFGGWGRGSGCFGGHHRRYDSCYAADYGCYSTGYSDYAPAVFGSSMPIYETPISSGQAMVAPSKYGTPASESAPSPVTPATPPSPKPLSTQPEETT
ncbi:MAG TPA: hypothetical protein VJY33_17830, partial [Isosphaeraceae bacterium]|nr:hypothetical protein [Isosphaeraceae bacterium]